MHSQPREAGVDDRLAEIEIEKIRVGHRVVLAVSGELDLATAPTLQGALDDAVDSGAAEIWIDLSDVRFMDSTALRVLLAIRRRLRLSSTPLAVICPDGPVRRVFEIAGLEREFNL